MEHAAQHQDLWALVLGSEGTAHLRGGSFDAACTSLAEALVASASAGCEPQRLRCLAVLALTEVCRGNLSRGQEFADTAEGLLSRVVSWPRTGRLPRTWRTPGLLSSGKTWLEPSTGLAVQSGFPKPKATKC